jgi:hypothetical protein
MHRAAGSLRDVLMHQLLQQLATNVDTATALLWRQYHDPLLNNLRAGKLANALA